MELNRRDFLRSMGAGAFLMAAGGLTNVPIASYGDAEPFERLDTHDYRWVRAFFNGKMDAENLESRWAQGWQPVQWRDGTVTAHLQDPDAFDEDMPDDEAKRLRAEVPGIDTRWGDQARVATEIGDALERGASSYDLHGHASIEIFDHTGQYATIEIQREDDETARVTDDMGEIVVLCEREKASV